MKKNDNFIEWLRDKVLDNPQEPSGNAWQQISDSLDFEDAWSGIGEELDIESVWEKVDHRLFRYESLQLFEKISSGLSVLALLPFFLYLVLLPENDNTGKQNQLISTQESALSQNEESRKQAGREQEISGGFGKSRSATNKNGKEGLEEAESGAENKDKEVYSPSGVGTSVNPSMQVTGKSTSLPSQDEESDFPAVATGTEEEGVKAYEFQEIPLFNPPGYIFEEPVAVSIALPEVDKSEIIAEERRKDSSVQKMTLGIGSSAKISWLVNNKTLEAWQRESLTTAVPAVYNDLFLLYGLPISNNISLQADFYLFDWSGQQYREYREGTYGKVENKLLYRSLGLSLLKQGQQIGHGSNPVFPYYQAGIYGGLLQQAMETAFNGSADRTGEFSRLRMGLQLGYGYDWHVLNNLALSYGIGARLDLLNVYSGTSAIPASFRRTRNASLDFKLSVKYLIGK